MEMRRESALSFVDIHQAWNNSFCSYACCVTILLVAVGWHDAKKLCSVGLRSQSIGADGLDGA